MPDESDSDGGTPSRLMQDLLHAIGQPLTSLGMCALQRDRPLAPSDSYVSVLHAMAGQVELLTRLFGTLRRIVEWETHPLETTPVELHQLIRQGVPAWRAAALRRDITIEVLGIVNPADTLSRPPIGALASCLEALFELALESTAERGLLTFELVHQEDASCLLRIRGGDQLADLSHGRFTLDAAKLYFSMDLQHLNATLRPFEVVMTVPSEAVIREKTRTNLVLQGESQERLLR